MRSRTARHRELLLALIACLPVLLLPVSTAEGDALPCIGGTVDGYPCSGVILMSRLSETDLGTFRLGDNWGWKDPVTGVEYAILAAYEGAIFVSLENPESPVVIGYLPTHSGPTNPPSVPSSTITAWASRTVPYCFDST